METIDTLALYQVYNDMCHNQNLSNPIAVHLQSSRPSIAIEMENAPIRVSSDEKDRPYFLCFGNDVPTGTNIVIVPLSMVYQLNLRIDSDDLNCAPVIVNNPGPMTLTVGEPLWLRKVTKTQWLLLEFKPLFASNFDSDPTFEPREHPYYECMPQIKETEITENAIYTMGHDLVLCSGDFHIPVKVDETGLPYITKNVLSSLPDKKYYLPIDLVQQFGWKVHTTVFNQGKNAPFLAGWREYSFLHFN